MMKFSLLVLFGLCVLGVYPAVSISRWFSASYQDLRVTMRRYGHCAGELKPLKDQNQDGTGYLIQQAKTFLDHAAFDNDQLLNISALMDQICPSSQTDAQPVYPISIHINVSLYSNSETGKSYRCKAVEDIMDSMYNVLKRAAWNKSEPLDFSIIQFNPNKAQQGKEVTYNLTDLINTSWIASNTPQDLACRITDSIKRYVADKVSTSTPLSRSEPNSYFSVLFELIDSLLNPILGSTRRLFLEGSNSLEMINSQIGIHLGNLRNGIGSRFNRTKVMLANVFTPSNSTIITNSTRLNSTATTKAPAMATTQLPNKPTVPSSLDKTTTIITKETTPISVTLNGL